MGRMPLCRSLFFCCLLSTYFQNSSVPLPRNTKGAQETHSLPVAQFPFTFCSSSSKMVSLTCSSPLSSLSVWVYLFFFCLCYKLWWVSEGAWAWSSMGSWGPTSSFALPGPSLCKVLPISSPFSGPWSLFKPQHSMSPPRGGLPWMLAHTE